MNWGCQRIELSYQEQFSLYIMIYDIHSLLRSKIRLLKMQRNENKSIHTKWAQPIVSSQVHQCHVTVY